MVLPFLNDQYNNIFTYACYKSNDGCITVIIPSIKPRKKALNLTSTERSAITSLKQKPYIYSPSDKGGEFCVMTKEEYNDDTVVSHCACDFFPKILER